MIDGRLSIIRLLDRRIGVFVMGCVFGKTISGHDELRRQPRRMRKNDEQNASENDHTVRAVQNGVWETGDRSSEQRLQPAIVAEFKLRSAPPVAADEWPSWLLDVAGHAIKDWKPRRANTYEKLDKVGQGTYSNVYKARDLITGKVVALKKIRFGSFDPGTLRFMSREILVLRRLNHPNVIRLEGLVLSRISCSLYLVFQYMEHDLAGLAAVQTAKFTEVQIKCYMKQLISGLEHCHNNGVLHRDIKCSNLLIDDEGVLKIADFGLASFFDPEQNKPMTSRVVTLWYRPPELLLGATYYGAGVDLWSAGCVLAELLVGKAILRGRTEVEQLHKIFKLCGSPSEEYWQKSVLTNATLYKPQQPYKRCLMEICKEFPPSSISLLENLLAIDPEARGTCTAALNSEFFTTEPYPCAPSSLPKFPPSKELDIKLKVEEIRQRGSGSRHHRHGGRRARVYGGQVTRAMPVPVSSLQVLQPNLEKLRIMSGTKLAAGKRRKSDKFPPPHHDGGGVGHVMINTSRINPTSAEPFNVPVFDPKSSRSSRVAPPQRFIHALFNPSWFDCPWTCSCSAVKASKQCSV